MRRRNQPVVLLVLFIVVTGAIQAWSAPLAPNDPSINANLISWLRYAEGNYSDGTWRATVGPDARPVGDAGDGDFYDVPVPSTISPEDGLFAGQENISGVLFDFGTSDLLWAEGIDGGNEMDELTLIAVYQTEGNTDRTRPVGIGSRSEDVSVLGDAFNLSSDASLRYDNGNNQTDPGNHPIDLVFRAATLVDGLVSDYIDGENTIDEEVPGGSFAGVTRNDDLYLGDVRGGINDSFAGTSPEDIFVAEIVVYNAALSEDAIVGIGDWLVDNVGQGVGQDPMLQAGDADRDLDFDQLDLVQVQIAAKYLTGLPATWGEGDWDGAPGGNAGAAPAGNGRFDQLDIIAALGAGKYLTGPYGAVLPGGKPDDGQTSVTYNPDTGEVGVDAPAGTELTSINIDSAAGIFTGDPAQNLGGSFDNDADNNVFKATFGSSFGSLSFGNVAQTGLSEDFVANDLTVVGSLSGGGDLGAVDLIYVPEPSALVLLGLGVAGMLLTSKRKRD